MQTHEIPRGTITALEGGMARVRIDTGGCQGCGQGSSCSIGRMASGRKTELSLVAPEGLEVGQQVTLSLPERGLHTMAIIGYLMPALAMVLGAAIAHAFYEGDGPTAIGAILGFLLSLALIRLIAARAPALMPPPTIDPPGQGRVTEYPLIPLSYTEPNHER